MRAPDRDTRDLPPARLGRRRRRENLTRETGAAPRGPRARGASQTASDATRRAMPGAVEPAEADAAAAAAAVTVGRRRPTTASERRRMYRDLAVSLRCGLRDAAAGFSFLRLRGLRAILRALRSAADDADAGLFRDSQSIRDLKGPTSLSRLAVVAALLPLPSLFFSISRHSLVPMCVCSGPGAVRAQPAQGGGARGARGADGGAGAGHGARRRQAQEPRHRLRGRARAQGARRLLPPLPGLRLRRAPLQCRQGTATASRSSVHLTSAFCFPPFFPKFGVLRLESELFVQQCNAMSDDVLLLCPTACIYR